jgi:hypothetical protein
MEIFQAQKHAFLSGPRGKTPGPAVGAGWVSRRALAEYSYMLGNYDVGKEVQSAAHLGSMSEMIP